MKPTFTPVGYYPFMANDNLPPAHATTDWTANQDWSSYTAADNMTWYKLFSRQAVMLPMRAISASRVGQRGARHGVPDFDTPNERLHGLGPINEGQTGAAERVIHAGTQAHTRKKARA